MRNNLGAAMANLTWDWQEEGGLLAALAGSGLGDSIREAWPELVRRETESAGNISRYLQIGSEDVVAKIGAGIGLVTAMLLKQAGCLISLNISESFQRIARATATADNVEFHLISPGDLSPLRARGANLAAPIRSSPKAASST